MGGLLLKLIYLIVLYMCCKSNDNDLMGQCHKTFDPMFITILTHLDPLFNVHLLKFFANGFDFAGDIRIRKKPPGCH